MRMFRVPAWKNLYSRASSRVNGRRITFSFNWLWIQNPGLHLVLIARVGHYYSNEPGGGGMGGYDG